MLYLTKHEKGVLLSLAVIVMCGSVIDAVFKFKPWIARSVSAEDRFVNRTNVNTADFDELVRVPYIGEVTAHSIMRYRREKAGFVPLTRYGRSPGFIRRIISKWLNI